MGIFDRAKAHKKIEQLHETIARLNAEVKEKQGLVETFDDAILVQSFGLYEPRYDFTSSAQYKERLGVIREKQKDMIRAKAAVLGSENWHVNDDRRRGRRMIKDVKKLLLRAFNSECDEVVRKTKYSNIQQSIKKIRDTASRISSLGEQLDISINPKYVSLKEEEAQLAFEHSLVEQEEKEKLRELQEIRREQKKVDKEIEEEKKRLEKERSHYSSRLGNVEMRLFNDKENDVLASERVELEQKIDEIEKSIDEVDYRKANERAGYVYVISNVGSFGEGVVKIGMTRRLHPYERVSELSSASVPFRFDVHAMVFSDDAPTLERAMHNEFSDRQVNLVNRRKEFFRVPLSEVRLALEKNHDKPFSFYDFPDAVDYRRSKAISDEGEIEA